MIKDPPDMNITTEKYDNWHIISIEGSFVVQSISEIRKVFESIEKDVNPQVAINLTKTSYIDSSAITTVLNYQKRLVAAKGRLVIFGPNRDIQGIFSIVNLDDSVTIYKSRSEFESTVKKG